MMLLKSRIAPLPKPCGKCGWFCLECGRVWDCFEEGGCRGDRLIVCPKCWAVLVNKAWPVTKTGGHKSQDLGAKQ